MSDPYLGEIRMVGFTFNPRHWQSCDGQILPISSNESLYSLLGTAFGGDGRTTYGLPDMRGRVPIGVGQGPNLTNRSLGEHDGEESVDPGLDGMPSHTHTMRANSDATPDQAVPENNSLGGNVPIYRSPTGSTLGAMASAALSTTVGGGAHDNMGPSLTVRFIICVEEATFPPRN